MSELTEGTTAGMTAVQNMKLQKESSEFNQAIVLFLAQWAIISIALILYALLK